MKKILVTFLLLVMTVSLVFAIHPDKYDRYKPSFNVKLREGGNDEYLRGDPVGNVILSRGDSIRFIVRHLEPDTYYSLYYDDDNCVDVKTNNNGNARSTRLNDWMDYSDLYELKDTRLGAPKPSLKEGVDEDFKVYEFRCTSSDPSTDDPVLEGVAPKHHVQENVPGGHKG